MMMSRESYQVREAMGAEIRPFFFFFFSSFLSWSSVLTRFATAPKEDQRINFTFTDYCHKTDVFGLE